MEEENKKQAKGKVKEQVKERVVEIHEEDFLLKHTNNLKLDVLKS